MIRIVLQTLGERRIHTKSTPNLAKFITEDLNRLCTRSNWDLMNNFELSLIFCLLYSSYHKDIFVDVASRWYLLRWHCNKRPQLKENAILKFILLNIINWKTTLLTTTILNVELTELTIFTDWRWKPVIIIA